MLHRIELNHRSLEAGHYPPGMCLLLRALPALLHDGDPQALLDVGPVMARLRSAVSEPGYVETLVRESLIENPHRVRLTLVPDPTLSARQEADERARLDALKSRLDRSQRAQLVRTATELKSRQESQVAPNALPTLCLDDVASAPPLPTGISARVDGMQSTRFTAATNGLLHEHVIVDLPKLDEDLVDLLPLFGVCLTAVGCDGQDYLKTQERQAEISGGISAYIGIRCGVSDAAQTRSVMVLSGTALESNHSAISQLLNATLLRPRFDELPRLKELTAQLRARRDEAVIRRGHLLAVAAAGAGTGPSGATLHRGEGLEALKQLRRLDASLSDSGQLAALSERLGRIGDAVARAPRQLLSVTETGAGKRMQAELERLWGGAATGSENEHFIAAWTPQKVRQGWSTASGVNFCAKAYPVVPEAHVDAAVFKVLGPFLRNQFLHGAIRERGGAYGAGAGYCPDTATFRFFSYRDPRLGETLADFDRALDWLQSSNHPAEHLKEAVLSAIAELDRPLAPAAEARATFFAALHGRNEAHRRRFRQAVLEVTVDDLRAVASRYLRPERAGIAVVSSAERLRRHAEPRLELQPL